MDQRTWECPRCKRKLALTLENFYTSGHTPNGFQCYCKECSRAAAKECKRRKAKHDRHAKARAEWLARHPEDA